MGDVRATFYGDGLIQAMAKNYKPNPKRGSIIAFNRPELISQEYIDLNAKLHRDNPTYGMGGSKHAENVLKLSKQLNTTSILDYGCGKGLLANALPFPIWEYDPAISEKSTPPKPADIVVCTDVLEHIEPDKLPFVLDDLRRCVKKIGYFVISTRKAVKTYANGQNTHLIVQNKDWWEKKLKKHFELQPGSVIEKPDQAEVQFIVGVKTVAQPDITMAEKGDLKVKFFTPNDTTKWRANTLFTKEPATIQWIEGMKAGEVMYDIGANVGSYSILAGVKGMKVFAFEPEAENYALLCKNLSLNGIEPNAYCMALSDEEKAGTLYAGQREAGGACHSFGQSIGHDLRERNSVFTQGCFGIPLDTLVERGLPHPQHIKIDVDGLEYKVIKGAEKTLMNGVKSLLVEVNPSLPQHVEMIDYLTGLGFEYDEKQVESAKRKEGTFKGVAEYVFTKNKNRTLVNLNIGYSLTGIATSEMNKEPFNHIFIDDFLIGDYPRLINNFPENYIEIEKSRGTRGYPLRSTAECWPQVKSLLYKSSFKGQLLAKFGIKDEGFTEDILLVRDLPGYQISPHTDSTTKVITVLIYLPEDNSMENEGTSLFVPKQEGFTCSTGRHYSFEDFHKVKTMPFKPNSMFAFARTDNSFHGVLPSSHVRNVLLYNIKRN